MLITDLPAAERAFWMEVVSELDADETELAPVIAPRFDAAEEPDIDGMLALIAAQS